jgi:hypothetical protein
MAEREESSGLDFLFLFYQEKRKREYIGNEIASGEKPSQ